MLYAKTTSGRLVVGKVAYVGEVGKRWLTNAKREKYCIIISGEKFIALF